MNSLSADVAAFLNLPFLPRFFFVVPLSYAPFLNVAFLFLSPVSHLNHLECHLWRLLVALGPFKLSIMSKLFTCLFPFFDIFRLASKCVWYSVLLYDKEYRDMQADEKFECGTYRQDLRDFQLVSKRDNPTARAINEASGATKARGKLSVNNDRRRGPFLPDGWEICRSFNSNSCYRQDCKMMHHCAICMSSTHSALSSHGHNAASNYPYLQADAAHK
jgi:hypothetical protein